MADPAQPSSAFSVDDIKPYLESEGVKNSFVGIAAGILGAIFGTAGAVLAQDVWQAVAAVGGTVLAGSTAYAAVRTLIARFRALKRIG